MNTDTDYVHTHVVNYEPTYLVLMDVATDYRAGDIDMWVARDAVADSVFTHRAAMGLDPSDLSDDVDYGAMVLWEIDNED